MRRTHLDVPILSTERNAHSLLDRHLMESESSEPDWENELRTRDITTRTSPTAGGSLPLSHASATRVDRTYNMDLYGMTMIFVIFHD